MSHCTRHLRVEEYDDAAPPKLLSLGNRFVRNVKRAAPPRRFAYSDLVQVHLHDRLFPRSQLLAVGVLVAVLAALGTLQYRWLGEVSEAERARMRDSLRTRAGDFAREFDRELTRVYLAFHVDIDAFNANAAAALADALDRAQTSSAARIVKDVFLVERIGAAPATLRHLDRAEKTLAPVEWPAALDAWRRQLGDDLPLAHVPLPPVFLSDAIDAALPALVIPVPQVRRLEQGRRVAVVSEPGATGRAVLVWLDAERLQHQLLEPLVTKYFGGGDTSEYLVSIVQRADASRVVYASPQGTTLDEKSADVSTGLFDLRVDEVSRLAGLARADLPPAPDGAPLEKVAITIVRRAAAGDGTRVLMRGGDNQGAWQVRVRYRGGSLDALVAQSRRRNLAIGLGVLALLGASVILVFAAAHRQRRLARQQMEFVAAVSHELRTPLAVICSAGENLADGVVAEGDQVKRYGSLIETEGRRLGDMVERVLQFAGIGSGAQTQLRTEVDIAEAVAAAAHGVAADARDRGVTLTIHPPAALPPVIGDMDALRSAIQNIVGNAVKYSPAGSAVDVTTELLEGGIVRVRVVDRGIGIDAADVPHIFKPFFRGRRALDSQVRGSGVGLSVVHHVVQAHGGDLQIESRVGEGTTATVVLPTAAAGDARGRGKAVVRLRRGPSTAL